MASEHGLGPRFKATLSSQGYLAESAFYAIMGCPDTVVLHDQGFDEVADSLKP
jgi:hypothetical protein